MGMKNFVLLILTATAPLMPLSVALAAEVPPPAKTADTASPNAPGFLGIQLDEVDEALTYHLGLTNDLGVLVAGVAGGSAGESMGLKQFDVIVSADDAPIYTPRALGDVVKAKHAGEVLRLSVRRGANTVALSGKLSARPAEMAQPERHQFHRPLPGQGPILGPNGQRRGTMMQPDGSTMEWSIDESPEPPASGGPSLQAP